MWLITKEEKILGYSFTKEEAYKFAKKKKAAVWKKVKTFI